MPTLIELMKDPSVVVRDTAAWTVGRICEMLPEAAINDIYLAPLLQCLIEGLSAEPRVASNVCWVRQTLCFCCWEASVSEGYAGTQVDACTLTWVAEMAPDSVSQLWLLS